MNSLKTLSSLKDFAVASTDDVHTRKLVFTEAQGVTTDGK
jgi:hypothetical protein